jgi:hypothetical protein
MQASRGFVCIFVEVGIEPKDLCMLGKYLTIVICTPSLLCVLLNNGNVKSTVSCVRLNCINMYAVLNGTCDNHRSMIQITLRKFILNENFQCPFMLEYPVNNQTTKT